ncbi:hypothetical protein P7H06_23805 [Paenibacillus larvae]|nr:hypothetical protein [Paenibacillus larvae]MDT2241113.1 hypothetical protein [Paenibacillus larvae]MDT2261902.1 hypothetical protein [Paenibacillus larvae]
MTIWPSPSLWWIMAYSALAILLYGAINQWISVKKAASARDAFLRFEAGRFVWFRTSAEALRVVIFCLLSFALLLITGYGPAFFPEQLQ